MILLYNILDVSAYNYAFVLWKEVNPQWIGNKLHKRRIFLDEFGKSLVLLHITSDNINQEASPFKTLQAV